VTRAKDYENKFHGVQTNYERKSLK